MWNLLYLFSKILELKIFRWLHLSVRFFYLHFTLPGLYSLLAFRFSDCKFHLYTRNSVNEKNKFHALLSDLDLAIVFCDEATEKKIAELVHVLELFKKTFIFVGEFEIYSEKEWKIRCNLLEKYENEIKFVNGLRKSVWQINEIKKAKTQYHTYKIERSLKQFFEKYSVKIQINDQNEIKTGRLEAINIFSQKYIHSVIIDEAKSAQFFNSQNSFSHFLGFDIQGVPISFLSILPDAKIIAPRLENEIDAFRKFQNINELWQAVVCWEYFLCHSVQRLQKRNIDDSWICNLKSQIQENFT